MLDRFGIDGITGIHTALVTLSPAYLDALKKVAPKKRSSKARVVLVVALGIAGVLLALGLDRSTREFAREHLMRRGAPVAAAVAAAEAPPVSTTTTSSANVVAVPAVSRPTVIVDDPTPPPSSDAARKAATKKPAAKPTRKLEGRPGAFSAKVGLPLVAAKMSRGAVGS